MLDIQPNQQAPNLSERPISKIKVGSSWGTYVFVSKQICFYISEMIELIFLGTLEEAIYLMQRVSDSINEVNMNNRKRTLTVLVVTWVSWRLAATHWTWTLSWCLLRCWGSFWASCSRWIPFHDSAFWGQKNTSNLGESRTETLSTLPASQNRMITTGQST